MAYVDVPEVIYVNDWPHRLTDVLAQSAFGYVFRARTVKPGNSVIKIERPNVQPSQVENEWKIYGHLHGIPGIQPPTSLGEVNGLKYLVMKSAGQSLHMVFERLCNRLPPRKPFEIALNLINIVEPMHARGIVHRDIKPDNIMVIGAGGFKLHLIDVARVALVDFGLSVLYKNLSQTGDGDADWGGIAGTPLFASIHTHQGHPPRPRDDLESIAYVLLYLLRSNLPWQRSPEAKHGRSWSIVGDKKVSSSPVELTQGLPGHSQVAEMVEYCRKLEVDEPPDYQHIRDLLAQAMQGINSSTPPNEEQ